MSVNAAELLIMVHAGEKARRVLTAEKAAFYLDASRDELMTVLFPQLNAGYVVRDDVGGLRLTEAGRAQIGLTDGAEGAPQDG